MITEQDLKNAYGKHYNKLKPYMDEDGWIHIDVFNTIFFDPRFISPYQTDWWVNPQYYRPKQLAELDIENKRINAFWERVREYHKNLED